MKDWNINAVSSDRAPLRDSTRYFSRASIISCRFGEFIMKILSLNIDVTENALGQNAVTCLPYCTAGPTAITPKRTVVSPIISNKDSPIYIHEEWAFAMALLV